MMMEPKDDYEVGRPPKRPRREIDNTDWSRFNVVIPDNVVRFRDVVPIVVNELKIGDTIYGKIEDLYDLSKFYFIQRTRGIEDFFRDLERFYTSFSRIYKMSPQLVREELYCVVFNCNFFNRCVILNVLDNRPGFVKVFFIDTGNVRCVSITKLFYLNKQFAQLPAQAIRARLANIVPLRKNNVWDRAAIFKFYFFLGKITLDMAMEVVAIDKNMVLDILVWDPIERSCVNHDLVNAGYALWKHQEQRESSFNDPNCTPLVDDIHLYPTFDQLENSCGAISRNVSILLWPVHWYMPSYFNITLSWTDSIFDEVQKNCERNKKNNEFRSDAEICTIEEDHYDLSLINVVQIRTLLLEHLR